jgi:hypothetical protein
VAITVVAYIFLIPRNVSTHCRYRCVNRCTWSMSTRPNHILHSVLDGRAVMAVGQYSVMFADDIVVIQFIFQFQGLEMEEGA